MQYLLEVAKADVRLVDDCNTTVLHCLSKQRDVEIFDDVTIAAEFVLQVRYIRFVFLFSLI